MKVYEIEKIRTNNFAKDVGEKIGQAWKRAMPKFVTNERYGVYHSYDSDYKGDYTLSICSTNRIQDAKIFELNQYGYHEYLIATAQPADVIKAWQKIWDDEEKGLLHRAYTFDYEYYKADGSVSIYIALL